jgi:N-acetyl-gamma-glutamyl-phosphate reductase
MAQQMKKVRVGIVGGTGYTGSELLRLLARHPQAEVVAITSRGEAGVAVARLFPSLRGELDLAFTSPDESNLTQCDVVFFATPHGVAASQAAELTAAGVKVIDLAADFRLQDLAVWEKWYAHKHPSPELVPLSVYGLPEANREAIRAANIIGNPGCYPTATQLALMPLIEANLIDITDIIVDAKSGISGAGRGAKVDMLFAETYDSFKAYGLNGHRHLPEIEERLSVMAGKPVNMTFVPHLLPMIRGIEITAYANLTQDISLNELQALFEKRYANEIFVDVMPQGSTPETRTVKGTNRCRLAVYRPQGRDKVVVTSVIDNLTKGAAGQAVQNMNILFDLPESMGLDTIALLP